MSSILDALKKLEKDDAEQMPDHSLDWPSGVNTRQALYKSLSRKSSVKPLFTGIAAFVFMVFAAWFFWPVNDVRTDKTVTENQKPRVEASPGYVNEIQPSHHPITVPKRSPKATVSTEVPKVDLPSIPRHAARASKRRHREKRHELRGSRTPTPGVAETQPRGLTDKELVEIDDVFGHKESTENKMETIEEVMELSEIIEEHVNEPTEVLASPEPEAEPVQIDEDMKELLTRVPQDMLPPQKVVERGWLKLHAISWAEEPSSRVAVINSKLVKEGRRIDGALVSRIEQDYVVIEKNGEELMLPFGNH